LAFLRTTESLIANRKGREIGAERIDVFRLKDANAHAPSNVRREDREGEKEEKRKERERTRKERKREEEVEKNDEEDTRKEGKDRKERKKERERKKKKKKKRCLRYHRDKKERNKRSILSHSFVLAGCRSIGPVSSSRAAHVDSRL
jgi:hypothetical protein